MNLRFEWGGRKAPTNQLRHGVSFEKAMTVFGDPLARIFEDLDHSVAEFREIIIGFSQKQRLLIICFTKLLDIASWALQVITMRGYPEKSNNRLVPARAKPRAAQA